jgi:uncharacterized protein involved in exopolysaccharide biosynthesis
VLRSDQLAWKVITGLKLYQAPGFMDGFAGKFPDFHAEAPAADAQAWLLERFQKRLRVGTLPRTLMIQIRFRCRDAALSASVVNALIAAYGQQDAESRVQATLQASRRAGSVAAGGLPAGAWPAEYAGDDGQRPAGRDAAHLGLAGAG